MNSNISLSDDDKTPLTKPRRGRQPKETPNENNTSIDINDNNAHEDIDNTISEPIKKTRKPKTAKQLEAFKNKCVTGLKEKTQTNHKLLIESAKTILKKELEGAKENKPAINMN